MLLFCVAGMAQPVARSYPNDEVVRVRVGRAGDKRFGRDARHASRDRFNEKFAGGSAIYNLLTSGKEMRGYPRPVTFDQAWEKCDLAYITTAPVPTHSEEVRFSSVVGDMALSRWMASCLEDPPMLDDDLFSTMEYVQLLGDGHGISYCYNPYCLFGVVITVVRGSVDVASAERNPKELPDDVPVYGERRAPVTAYEWEAIKRVADNVATVPASRGYVVSCTVFVYYCVNCCF